MNALLDEVVSAEGRRRGLLRESDRLLDSVETLRLRERTDVPSALGQAIRSLQERMGRRDPQRPRTVRHAHNLIFAVQQRLLGGRPGSAVPRAHLGRGMGQPVFAAVAPGRTWKLLALPSPSGSPTREAWLDLVEDTVERACDRWAYAQHQAVRAAREGRPVAAALAIADAAWSNYYELRQEADRLHSGSLEVVSAPL